ncbi:hypothetical protein M430DRAFT_21816 [Amorphotheca resinae ATCC 22711]|uniref:Uncharacterized protein n=1 Tax=Amorphotheca resinae ATCC 22711 TaxID=857342 RepID=A0A2T3AVQ8_AMORE|nr:hypothetical protein M430DRAFT_21816 [Amorphotheca resinae ATCC 22711]PSS12748.1 hypothetical protein M430DRAFT_21816 [Amorphotheca resinae ATCC 22711]
MPVRIHETAQIALGEILVYMKQTNFISYDQLHLLAGVVSGATYTGFVGPYAGTVKEPDALVRVRRRPQLWPIWVAEVGWSESRPSLDRDIDIWLRGTDYMVLLTILLKYDLRMSSTIAGYIIFYTQNGTRINRREIFPAPPNPIDDQITFTREELFGDSLTLEPGQAPGDTYTIDVSVFRSFATEYAELMGLTPVT